jgi:hypothetical protein
MSTCHDVALEICKTPYERYLLSIDIKLDNIYIPSSTSVLFYSFTE